MTGLEAGNPRPGALLKGLVHGTGHKQPDHRHTGFWGSFGYGWITFRTTFSPITDIVRPTGSITGFGYDANSNRTSWNGITYTIAANSNRLVATNALAVSEFTHDGAGNTQTYDIDGFGLVEYAYDSFDRMQNVKHLGATLGTYTYNGYGERSSKTNSELGRTRFTYAEDHRLLSEVRDTGSVRTNYLWFGGELVGLTRNAQRYAVHNDHLGRPEVVTNSSKTIVWKSQNGTFGGLGSVQDGSLLDNIGGFYVGFPGQYFDMESGLWYNLNRYYDHVLGRFSQVDPIGLASGANPYSYASGNPVSVVDPSGLESGHFALGKTPMNATWDQRPDYFQISVSLYVFSGAVILSRSGNFFASGGFTRDYPSPKGLGIAFDAAHLTDDCTNRNQQAI